MHIRSLFFFLFLISASFNAYQYLDNRDLRTANVGLESTVSEYKELFDSSAAEAHELEAISNHLRNKNSHVPSIVIDQWSTSIQQASQVYDISVNVLMQLYRVETATVHYTTEGFITVSHKNAGGIGQIMPFWYKDCPHSTRPRDLDNASINIMCSAYILRHYKTMVEDRFGVTVPEQNTFLALTAYNAGPIGVVLMLRGKDITNGYARNAVTGKVWRI